MIIFGLVYNRRALGLAREQRFLVSCMQFLGKRNNKNVVNDPTVLFEIRQYMICRSASTLIVSARPVNDNTHKLFTNLHFLAWPVTFAARVSLGLGVAT